MPSSDSRTSWDVIVIGGGPVGENAAQYAIDGSDRSAVIVEAELVGGECSYWACMPSKTLLRPVELRSSVAGVPGTTQEFGAIDVAGTLKRRDAFTHNRNDRSQVMWAQSAGIDVVRGRGRLTGEKTVSVTAADGSVREITATHAVVLATGTTASIPPVTGLREALPWTSRDATNMTEVPRRVAVVGGGVVACESATWLKGLGAEEVTLINRDANLLAGREPFVSSIVAEQFTARGIRVLAETQLSSVARPGASDTGVGHIHGGPAQIDVGSEQFEVDEIVVAAGRAPASRDLGLDTIGLDVSDSHGFVPVDDHLAVTGHEDWLYAVGDVNGRALLTHMGKYQGRIAGAVIAARAEGRPTDGPQHRDVADHGAVPGVIFTDPEVATVGLSEAAAREQGIDTETLEYDLASVAGSALVRDDYVGRAKLVVDRSSDVLVGATFVGTDVGELLHSATVAIVGKVPLSVLWHAVPSYPTVSEIWLRLLAARGVSAWT